MHFELDAAKHSPEAISKKEHFRRQLHCKVVPIRRDRRRFVDKAIAHARSVLNDKLFQMIVYYRRMWVGTTHGSRQILRNLTKRQLTVHVTAFRRDARHPCKTHFADGHTNAFVPDVRRGKRSKTRLLFLSERYVDEQYFAPEPGKGVRNLARTLIHEALHIMGYSHAGEVAFSKRYNRTVPVYMGCMVMNWGKLTRSWANKNCHRATGFRPSRSPFRWLCYTNRSLRRHVGRKLWVTTAPDRTTNASRRRAAILLRVHEDNTVTIRWRAGGQRKRVSKCRVVM